MFVVTELPNMSLSAKREVLVRIHGRYQRAGRPHKSRIVTEFCALCGYHPKSALRLLNRPLPVGARKRSGPKITHVPAEVLPGLKAVRLANDQLCSKLLKAPLSCRLQAAGQSHLPKPLFTDKVRWKFRYKKAGLRVGEKTKTSD